MKKIFHFIYCALILSFFAGCDRGFEELNIDPNSISGEDFHPGFLLTNAQVSTVYGDDESSLYYGSAFVQHMASLSDVGIFNYQGDKYVYLESPNDQLWENSYENMIKLIQDIIYHTKGKPEYHNLYQMTRIWRTLIFHRLTDIYGDVPYSEAGLAFYEQIYRPKYDPQKDIYMDMLRELEEAVDALDPAQENFGEYDIAYKGDLEKWKKLGNSMMLRLGMRLSKVDPATAESWAKKAFAGGVMTTNGDNLLIRGTDATGAVDYLTNGMSFILRVRTSTAGKISKTFFDFLKEHNDPRLKHTVAVYTDPNNISTENTDPDIQKGLPNGLNRVTLENDPSYDPSLPAQEHQYSGVKRNVYAKLDGPRMLVTYPEMQFLAAEAAVRGWISADAKQLYESGVEGAMKLLQQFEESAVITDEEIKDYLTENPFAGDDMESALEQINTQFWAATFLNGLEAYANVRRSGHPVLTPVVYPDNETGGKYPRRLKYPKDEKVMNADHYNEAVSRQGPDEFLTPVWWDVD